MRFPRVLLALSCAGLFALAVSSCRPGATPTGVSANSAPAAAANPGLLQCQPLPFASISEVIGPEGGDLQIGPHTLHVPAGALTQPMRITGQVVDQAGRSDDGDDDDNDETPSNVVNSVRLLPEGLHFVSGKPATLTMTYANCNLLGSQLPKRIAYTTDGLDIVSYLVSLDNVQQQQVSGEIEHFSRYAVAW